MTNCVICHKALKIIMNENELVCVCFDCIKKQNSKRFDYYVPSINKAKKTLNLKISIGLNEALNSTIKHLNDSN